MAIPPWLREQLSLKTPEDAFRCFMGSDIETPIVGNCAMHKEPQNPERKLDHKHAFEPD